MPSKINPAIFSKALMEALGQAHGASANGPITGPGTGTSDDVPMSVPEGTYIMPADSTKALRLGSSESGRGFNPEAFRQYQEQQETNQPKLGFGKGSVLESMKSQSPAQEAPGLGWKSKGVKIHASNGEYAIPPEQVQAIGALVLDAVKGATHEPSGQQPGEGFYADGGAVQLPNKPKDMTDQLDAATKQARASAAPAAPATSLAPQPATQTPQPTASHPGYAGSATGGSNDLTGKLDAATQQAQGGFSKGWQSANVPAQDVAGQRNASGPLAQAASKVDRAPGIELGWRGRSAATPAAASPSPSPAAASPGSASNSGDPYGHMTSAQRSQHADAYGRAVDQATGTDTKTGLGWNSNMGKRFDAYQNDPGLMATRNAREDMLGSGIQFSKGWNGGLNITNTGNTAGRTADAGGSSINMNEGNAVLARANATRQSMIDSQSALAGRGTYTGNGPSQAEKLQSAMLEQQGDLSRRLEDAGKIHGRSRRSAAVDALRAEQMGLNTLQQAATSAQAMDLRANEMAQQGQIANDRNALDQQRLAMGLPAMEGQQIQNDQARTVAALQQRVLAGDKSAAAQLQAIQGKAPEREKLQTVQTDNGLMVFDPRSGAIRQATDSNGRTIQGTGKALNESQAKATGFGSRAAEANQIINEVGNGGEVKPSLLKRAAEAVPLVGEGLGMLANKFASKEQQQVEQGERDFINAILRQESGAVISDQEFANARKQYFPMPGDSPEVIAQKAANRQTSINALRVAAGPGGKHIGGGQAGGFHNDPGMKGNTMGQQTAYGHEVFGPDGQLIGYWKQ